VKQHRSQQELREYVASQFSEDGVDASEVVLRDDGYILIDRREKHPLAEPIIVGEWRPGDLSH